MYEIGKFYKVPCVRGQWHNVTHDWPVMGLLHSDAEIIKFPEPHYHIDWRFVRQPFVGEEDGLYVFRRGRSVLQENYSTPLTVGSRINVAGLPAPVLRRRKCQRLHDLPFDLSVALKSWVPKLEEKYAGCKLAAGHVCPHRGFDLSHEPVNADGTITCPLHGLRWNAATGELAPRAVLK